MMRLLLIPLLALLAPTVQAQDRGWLEGRARQYMDTLTSESFHGRGYFGRGDAIAADWLGGQFKRLGLKPVKQDFFQPFTFNVNSFPDSVKVSIDGKRLTPGVDFIVDPASGPASGSYRLVHLTLDDLLTPERRAMTMGVIVGNAACVHFEPTTDKDTLDLQAAMVRELMLHGPVVKAVQGKLTWGVAREAMRHPVIEVVSEALTDSSMMLDLQVRNELLVRHQARNVLGMAKGKGKGWVVVGAHYDHLGRMGPDALFPGANDNASGVAMMLSLAEYFAKNPAKHNILFVAFAGEEAGLVGSEWCVVDRPIDWAQVKLMINLDIMGTGDEGITVVNATAQQAAFDRLVAINNTAQYLPEVKSRGPACNSDHCPFVKRGIPAIFIYTLGGVAHYHDVHDKAATLPLTKFADLYALLKEFINSMK